MITKNKASSDTVINVHIKNFMVYEQEGVRSKILLDVDVNLERGDAKEYLLDLSHPARRHIDEIRAYRWFTAQLFDKVKLIEENFDNNCTTKFSGAVSTESWDAIIKCFNGDKRLAHEWISTLIDICYGNSNRNNI